MAVNANPLGGFLSGFANGFSDERDRRAADLRRQQARQDRLDARQTDWADVLDGGGSGRQAGPGAGGTGGSSRRDGDMGAPARMQTQDPVNMTLTPYQRAFINSIAPGESAGKYNVRYTPDGGTTFDLNGTHPRIYENGPAGQSSAAGRYQFVWSTWKDIAGADTPFTPENQDLYAWKLAARDYLKNTGRSLDEDLQRDGLTPSIQHALNSTWTSFGNSRVAGSTYADSLARYSQSAQQPAAARPATGRSIIPQPASAALSRFNPADFLLGQAQ